MFILKGISMKSILIRATLLLITLTLASNVSAFERKAEWAKYARGASHDNVTGSDSTPAKGKVVTDLDKISYSVGMSIGEDLKQRGIMINPDLVARGIQDMLNGEGTVISKQEAMQILSQFQEQMAEIQQEELARIANKNLSAGKAFLERNAQRDTVVQTATGLQYEILYAGTGKTPSAEDIVTVDYSGMYIDGKEFDSSYQRGEPVEFSVNGIIPGWTEALLMMKEGAKWRLFIPADLAYGAQGAPPVIEPFTTLVFEVELKSILNK
jgi:FKBP-type peptidyl-prolyl cis-trans isomerase FklB